MENPQLNEHLNAKIIELNGRISQQAMFDTRWDTVLGMTIIHIISHIISH
jgi:hypothetical protein